MQAKQMNSGVIVGDLGAGVDRPLLAALSPIACDTCQITTRAGPSRPAPRFRYVRFSPPSESRISPVR